MSALTLAVPSKGRLKEQTEDFFREAGYAIAPLGGSRGYLARIPALPDVEVRLLSASEIASGALPAQRAFVEGRLRVGGDLSLLIAHQRAFAAVTDALAPIRADTTYE